VGDEGERGLLERVAAWVDSRLGLSYQLLRPAPAYSLNPFYWLGALAVVAFVIQGVTGTIMMLYYVPDPTAAYTSTQYIYNNVTYGRFLETVHLYTAYAMIMLAFMHMMRGYFVSVHKKPREVMWVVGMAMGFVTLGFGFTGYLLPWTVVSKSATDVGVGMIDALPQPLSSFLSFLIVGAGGDATELLRFYDLHVVVLPAVLLVLLVVKMYMLEAHGISRPATGNGRGNGSVLLPIFPDVTLYLLQLAAIFGAGMLLISIAFPLSLPPAYTPTLASQYTPQPDWYFLWIYQILKISVFETLGLPVALAAVTAIFIVLTVLPFIDRGERRRMLERPVYVTTGMIFVAEVVGLAYWGLITPGQVIPAEEAVLVLGSIALVVAVVSLVVYRVLFSKAGRRSDHALLQPKTSALVSFVFIIIVASGALAIGSAINSVVSIAQYGPSSETLSALASSVVGLVSVVLVSVYLLYRFDLASGAIRRRVRVLEKGWRMGLEDATRK
jgi:ubiquinol-cytochrome c reductase cytochrome b subunit